MAESKGKSRNVLFRKGNRPRRAVPRRRVRPIGELVVDLLAQPAFGWGLAIAVAWILLAGTLITLTRSKPLVAPGMVARETRTVRQSFTSLNDARTLEERQAARQSTPRVYRANEAVLTRIETELAGLPALVADSGSAADVEPVLGDRLGLTEERYAAIAAMIEGERAQTWSLRAERLVDRLGRHPILDEIDFAARLQSGSSQIELVIGSREELVPRDQALDASEPEAARQRIDQLARNAGFEPPNREAIVDWFVSGLTPTFAADEQLTLAAQDAAAAAVDEVYDQRTQGQLIFQRGERVSPAAYELLLEDQRQFNAEAKGAGFWVALLRILGGYGVAAAVALVLGGYFATFSGWVARRPERLAWISGLLLFALSVSCLVAVTQPGFLMLGLAGPVLMVAMLMVIAYGQRVAMAVGALASVLACAATGQPMGVYLLLVLGVGVAVWRLPEIRDRGSLVGMSLWASAALLIGAVVLALIDRPISGPSLVELTAWAAQAGFAGLLAGGVMLFVLPVVERAFGLATGMTLIELRDPKHELLRELQQKAPGTYNHSLNVASISEAAADAIGADALLTYVGALYHDAGKLSKPEYFVENQSGGPSKHDKLTPAVSLLVIVGHVKDGIELAKEYRLPRPLHYFIEAHHGTTLVEYFFHRARKKAEDGKKTEGETDPAAETELAPAEMDYRYPGPKPRTREVAILMLADAVESATRSMAEPTSRRIDALVRELASKRLVDGQFDECDLTFRELQAVVESIIKSVTAIYHGRIKYPSGAEKPVDKGEDKPATESAGPSAESGGDARSA